MTFHDTSEGRVRLPATGGDRSGVRNRQSGTEAKARGPGRRNPAVNAPVRPECDDPGRRARNGCKPARFGARFAGPKGLSDAPARMET